MHKLAEFRKLAFELNSLDNKEVVKTAGVLRKLKNFFKSIINTQYREEATQLRADTADTHRTIVQLEKKFRQLAAAIKDADVESYNLHLAEVKELIKDFWIEFGAVEVQADKLWYTTLEEMKAPGFAEKFQSHLPKEFDIELNKEYNEPIQNFSWFKRLKPDLISIRSGEGQTTTSILMQQIEKKLVNSNKMTKEQAAEYTHTEDNKLGIIVNFKDAIVNGTLLRVVPHAPHSKAPNVPFGQTDVFITTAPFALPKTTVKMQANVILIDFKTSVKRLEEFSLKAVKDVKVASASFKPEIEKTAGANFNAYKSLPDSFWVDFVNMSKRLGAKPEDLATVLYSESAFDSHATNEQNGRVVAKGLNQFIENTAKKAAGMSDSVWQNYESLPAQQQLPYIEKFFRGVGKQTGVNSWSSPEHLFVANFAPMHAGKADDPNTVLYKRHKDDGSVNPAYMQNKSLDKDNKGFISINDLKVLTKIMTGRMPKEILDKIKNAGGAGTGSSKEITPVSSAPPISLESAPPESVTSDDVSELLNKLYSGASGKLESIVKQSYKISQPEFLVTINSSNSFVDKLEYARVAANILRKYANAEVVITGSEKEKAVELSCNINGNTDLAQKSLYVLCSLVANKMKSNLQKNGKDINISVAVLPGYLSEYNDIDCVGLVKNNRKFNLSRLGGTNG